MRIKKTNQRTVRSRVQTLDAMARLMHGVVVQYAPRKQGLRHSAVINRASYLDSFDPTSIKKRFNEGADMREVMLGSPLRGCTITLANCRRPVQLDLLVQE